MSMKSGKVWLIVCGALVAIGIMSALMFVSLSGGGSTASDTNNEPSNETIEKLRTDDFVSPLDPQLAATNVLVRVNGRPITADDYNSFCRLQGALVTLKARSMPLTKTIDTNQYVLNNAAKFLYRLIRFEAMRQAVAKAGVVPSKAELKEASAKFLAGMNAGKTSLDKVSARLPKAQGKLLKERLYDEAAEMAYLKHWSTNNLSTVTEAEIDEGIRNMTTLRAHLEELNATNRLRAVAARDEILKKGRYFADVAKEYSEGDPEQGKMWDIVELAEFDASNPLGKWLATAKVGDISEPIEMDDGLCIVGVVSKEVGSSGELNGKDVDFYRLVRILFKIYDPPEELGSRKEIAEALLAGRRDAAMRQLGKELMEGASIEFPSGQEIFRMKPKQKKGKAKKAKKDVDKNKKKANKGTKAVINHPPVNTDK